MTEREKSHLYCHWPLPEISHFLHLGAEGSLLLLQTPAVQYQCPPEIWSAKETQLLCTSCGYLKIFILITTSKLPQSLLTTLKQHQFFIFIANFLYFDNQISK